MKNILLYIPDLGNNKIFTRDLFGFNDSFIYLKEKLNSIGYNIITSDDNSLNNCSFVIFLVPPINPNHFLGFKGKLKWIRKKIFNKKYPPIRNFYKECIENGYKDRMAIILWEGRAVCPENFSKSLHDKFKYIFTWNDDLVDNIKFFKFYHPIDRNVPNVPIIPFQKKKLLVNISMNKYSKYPQELYSARRNSITYFDKNYPNDFDLFGLRWNMPVNRAQKIFPWLVKKYSTYRGKVNKKSQVLPNYKFSLCYENLEGENGYISEKIFDCLRCGVLPIYWGAQNIDNFVDPDAFIDRRDFKSDKELGDFIKNMGKKEYNQHLDAAKSYLKSDKYFLFSAENFANTIINTLKL